MAPLYGLLLAGGRSRRFGSDKRFAAFGKLAMVEHALRKLRPVAGDRIFVAAGANPEVLPGSASHIHVRDAVPGAGPLGGIVAGLRRAPGGLLVLACDVPNVSPATLEVLAALGRRCDRPAAPRGARGWEPLVAYYPAWILTDLEAALRGRMFSLQAALDRLGCVALEGPAVRRLRNVNRPEDLAAAIAAEASSGRR